MHTKGSHNSGLFENILVSDQQLWIKNFIIKLQKETCLTISVKCGCSIWVLHSHRHLGFLCSTTWHMNSKHLKNLWVWGGLTRGRGLNFFKQTITEIWIIILIFFPWDVIIKRAIDRHDFILKAFHYLITPSVSLKSNFLIAMHYFASMTYKLKQQTLLNDLWQAKWFEWYSHSNYSAKRVLSKYMLCSLELKSRL